jgi:hypothetical protein
MQRVRQDYYRSRPVRFQESDSEYRRDRYFGPRPHWEPAPGIQPAWHRHQTRPGWVGEGGFRAGVNYAEGSQRSGVLYGHVYRPRRV